MLENNARVSRVDRLTTFALADSGCPFEVFFVEYELGFFWLW